MTRHIFDAWHLHATEHINAHACTHTHTQTHTTHTYLHKRKYMSNAGNAHIAMRKERLGKRGPKPCEQVRGQLVTNAADVPLGWHVRLGIRNVLGCPQLLLIPLLLETNIHMVLLDWREQANLQGCCRRAFLLPLFVIPTLSHCVKTCLADFLSSARAAAQCVLSCYDAF